MTDAYIYESIRSPRTKAKESGGLHELTPSELLAQLYETLARRQNLDPSVVSEVISIDLVELISPSDQLLNI